MKKVLRFIGVLILVLMVIVIVLGLIAPRDIKVERSITMNAPQPFVRNHMFHYNNFKDWNPWMPMDPTTKVEVTGEDGKPGAKYAWSGDKLGKGEMVASEITETELRYDMKFFNPWGESASNGSWIVEDAGNNQSKVTWTLNTHAGFPFNGIMMILGMDKKLGKDFDAGLASLKAYAEAHASDAPIATIQEVQFPGNTYAAIRKKISTDPSTMMKFFDESYTALAQAAGNRIAGPASCLAYEWDEENHQADLAPAFPVNGTEPVKGASIVTVNPAPAFLLVYTGGYGGMMSCHEQLGTYTKQKQAELSLVVEEYVKGPGDEEDSTKWVTNIYYILK